MNRRQFEYNSFLFSCRWEQVQFRLNEWGQEGWEAYYQHRTPRGFLVFFKREILPYEQDNQKSSNRSNGDDRL
jgi:hypothetical protein